MQLALKLVGLLYVLSAAVVGALCWRAFRQRAGLSVRTPGRPDNVIPFVRRPPTPVPVNEVEAARAASGVAASSGPASVTPVR